MKFAKKKIEVYLFTLFLMFAIAVSPVALLSIVSAQNVQTVISYIYVAPTPLVGVGQEMFLVYFTDRMPPDIGEAEGTAPGIRAAWYDIKLILVKPDGTNETFIAAKSDPVGAGYVKYTPTEVGTYTLQAFFPGVWKNSTISTTRSWYPSAWSIPANFTVRQEHVLTWPNVPLPTDYWMRPIGGPANSWYQVAGNWLGGAANVWPLGSGGVTTNYGYGLGPESAHILWTRQHFPTGSIIDERFGTIADRYGGYQAVGFSVDPILDGKIHVTPQKTVHDSSGGYAIWDLSTGELLSFDPNGTKPSFGQVYYYDTGNEHGLNVYLWKTTGITLPEIVRVAQVRYNGPNTLPTRLTENVEVNITKTPIVTGTLRELLDEYTGKTICYIANVSTAGTNIYGKDGSILYYNAESHGSTTNPSYYLTIWNSSAGTMTASQNSTGAWQWRPSGGSGSGASISYFGAVGSNCVHDGNIMWSLNVSMPSILGPRNSLVNQTASILAVREGEYIIFGTQGRNDERGIVPGWMMAVSLVRGQEGTKLWESTYTPPFSSTTWYQPIVFNGINPEQEVIVFGSETELLNPIVYDLKSGVKLWEGNQKTEPQFSYYGFQTLFYKDLIITGGTHSGVVTAYEAKTGNVRWTYVAKSEGTETPYGNALARGFYVADGKLYTSVSEHSPSSPLWRSPGLRCINITTGEEIWKILFWGSGNIRIADGKLIGWNWYDGQVYAFGQGPSATTVTASPKSSVPGTSLMIEGTITDQTPTGRRNVNNIMQFTLKDTPAISDESMTAWMQYKFMQQEMPSNATGVPVKLDAIDPNGNYIHIGETTSDMTGNYALPYTPEVPGTYQIIATFAGTKSYYPSFGTTYLTVEAPTATATPAPTSLPVSIADQYFIPATIGIFAAILAIGLVIILMLRKRP